MPVVQLQDAAAARAADEAAVAAGDTWHALMARAAGQLARGVVRATDGRLAGRRVVILAGPGNNGGDGWAVAPLLTARGAHVTVVAPAGLDRDTSDEAAAFRAAWRASGGTAVAGPPRTDLLAAADVVVDALLGTGSAGPLRGPVGAAVAAVAHERRGRPGLVVVAADLPSGVEADTGRVAKGAVRADVTVTFGGPKVGHLLAPGRGHAGRLLVGGLGPRHVAPTTGWEAATAATAVRPPLADDADKRARGRVLVVAGSADLLGAAVMCVRGVTVGGAGLVTAAVPDVVRERLALAVPAAMTRDLPSGADGELAAEAGDVLPRVVDLGADLDVALVGPGCGHGAGTRAVVARVLAAPVAVVLDADGMNAFRDDPDGLARHEGLLVLTPHDRELARLAGADVPADPAARVELAGNVARRLDAVVVAKGPSTVVVGPGGRRVVVPLGGPELGVGGSGDTLAGMVAAAVAGAQLDDPDAAVDAVVGAVFLHALAGTVAREATGPRPPVTALEDAVGPAAVRLEALAVHDPTFPLDRSVIRGLIPAPPRSGPDG